MKYILVLLAVIFSMCSPGKQEEATTGKAEQVRKSDTLPANVHMVDTAKGMIRSGDLVFRTGNDLVSFYFKQMNVWDNTYSHCGIASVEHGKVYIYHALGGVYNPGQQILHEPLEQFISPRENDGFGVFRYSFSPVEQEQMIKTAELMRHAGIRFDMDFDLETDDKMYCAEFVYKTMLLATNGRLRPEVFNAGLKVGVTTDNLFRNRNCKELGRFVYQ